MRNVIIQLRQVDVEYPAENQTTRRVLSGLDLDIERGEFVSIVGRTGCGKSTLLRLVLGEQKPTRGHVLVGGRERSQPDRFCGYVPQRYSLFSHKTVLDNVTFGLDVAEFGAFSAFRPRRRRKIKEFRAEALRVLKQMGLDEADARKYPHQLSGGMQQRVAIAQAVIMQPPVLLMDEAFSALDPGTRSGMQQLIKEVWRQTGSTVIFVTHNTREAVCLSTRVIALGGSEMLDVAVRHLDFGSDDDEIRFTIEQIETGSTDKNVARHVSMLQKSNLTAVSQPS